MRVISTRLPARGSAGIGGAGQYAGRKSKCGNITITGGKIIAKRDKGNWDIGPGDEGTCGSVKVDKNVIAPGMHVYGLQLQNQPILQFLLLIWVQNNMEI